MEHSRPAEQEVFSFARKERKYLLTDEQYRQMISLLDSRMSVDCFGRHTVNSIYFDTPDHYLIRHSLEHPVYKEKFRLRCYGDPAAADTLYAEIKKKYKGVVYKRRISGTPEEITGFLSGNDIPGQNPQIQSEIRNLFSRYDLRPACYVAYERTAWLCPEEPELRLTFDENIRVRGDSLSFAEGTGGEPILPESHVLLEIKFPRSAPLWLADLLSSLGIRPVTFSKYGTWFIRHARALCGR